MFSDPFYIDELKHKTGNDKEVQDYVMSFQNRLLWKKLEDFMEFMIPLYIEEGKFLLQSQSVVQAVNTEVLL